MTAAVDNSQASAFARSELSGKTQEAERIAGFHGRMVLEVVFVNNKIVGVEAYLKHQRKF